LGPNQGQVINSRLRKHHVAEKLAQSQVSLNYENDSTCPLNITYATTGSVEIARDTGKTPLYFIGLTCRVANNTNREIKNIGFTLSRAGSAIKEVPVRLFRSIEPNGSREFSIPSSPENLRYLPIILKERPEALILRIDGVGFEDGGGWGKVPQIPTAPIGILQFGTGQLPQRIRVGKNLQEANLLNQVAPVYPPVAKQARIQGMVVLEVTISREGDVSDARILSGHPLLIEAALEAVRQWKYKPTQLNGQPVEVVSSVEVQFTLDNNQGNSG